MVCQGSGHFEGFNSTLEVVFLMPKHGTLVYFDFDKLEIWLMTQLFHLGGGGGLSNTLLAKCSHANRGSNLRFKFANIGLVGIMQPTDIAHARL